MGLLDTFSDPSSGPNKLFQFLTKALPDALSPGINTPPQLSEAQQQMGLSGDDLDRLQDQRRQAYIAAQAAATRAGVPFYQLGSVANDAANKQYQSGVQQTYQDVQNLKTMREHNRSMGALDSYIAELQGSSDPADQQKAKALQMIDRSDPKEMLQYVKDQFPSKPAATQHIMTPGDGYSYLVDNNGKVLAKVGAGKLTGAAAHPEWADNPHGGPLREEIVTDAMPNIMALGKPAYGMYAVGRGKDTQPYYDQLNMAFDDYMKQMHVTPDQVASIRAGIAANTKSLPDLQKQQTLLEGFENFEKRNIQQALDLFEKVPDSGSPLINDAVRGVAKTALGNSDLALLHQVLAEMQPGIARILNDPAMRGAVTEGARNEMEKAMSGDMTFASAKKIFGFILSNFDARAAAMGDQLKKAQYNSGFHDPSAPPPAAAAPAPAAAATPKPAFRYENGKLIPNT